MYQFPKAAVTYYHKLDRINLFLMVLGTRGLKSVRQQDYAPEGSKEGCSLASSCFQWLSALVFLGFHHVAFFPACLVPLAQYFTSQCLSFLLHFTSAAQRNKAVPCALCLEISSAKSKYPSASLNIFLIPNSGTQLSQVFCRCKTKITSSLVSNNGFLISF